MPRILALSIYLILRVEKRAKKVFSHHPVNRKTKEEGEVRTLTEET